MLLINRLLLVGLLSVGISAATPARAGNQLFDGSWTVKALGNELTGGTGASAFYSAFGIPQGIQCNGNQPRCPFDSTPTFAGSFSPLGGSRTVGLFCAPWLNFGGKGTTARPAKGATPTTGGMFKRPIPPLYRNQAFFTPGGQPDTYSCTATSTNGFGGNGLVQAGQPVTGRWSAVTTGISGKGAFGFNAAAPGANVGVRTTGQVGEFPVDYTFVYKYSYATLRNDVGRFGPGSGPGSFNIKYYAGDNPVATINVKQGAAKFGGTMRMLGALTTKVCYYRNGGCSLGGNNWRYDAVGASVSKAFVHGRYVVTMGYQAIYTAIYYNTNLMQQRTKYVVASRFPWTTGSVTVKATGRGPHKTVHYAQGYDNRTTTVMDGVTNVTGTIQLVSPLMTRWLVTGTEFDFETAGIGILRIKFVPEPQMWATLLAGISLLGVATRMRAR